VIIKPVRVVAEAPAGTLRRNAAELAHDDAAVTAHASELGSCIVQRRIGGSVVSFGGAASKDGLLSWAVSRYERLWPADAGSACFSRTFTPPPELVEKVEALVSELQWHGIYELELIEDGDGQYRAIDFNPRPYGSLALAVGAGAPIPAVWCEWALGRQPARRVARAGVGYRWEDGDLRHAAWQLRHGHTRLALQAARPHRSVEHAYMSARDPLPPVLRSAELLLRAQEKARSRHVPSQPAGA
jgi:predicted ATP-grasp superfamily ATP-dependent carboligase